MRSAMTAPTERDQICFAVVSCPTPKLQMMHLKTVHCSAPLASPAISLKNLVLKFAVGFGREA